jgi:hypothetical protein
MIVFGGTTQGGAVNETWVLTAANGLGGTPQWFPGGPSQPAPSARGGQTAEPTAVFDQNTNRMVIFGGGASTLVNDTWVLVNASMPPGSGP